MSASDSEEPHSASPLAGAELPGLEAGDRVRLQEISTSLALLSDVCRADLMLFCQAATARAVIVAQAFPHSVSPLYESSRVGQYVGLPDYAEVIQGLRGRADSRRVYTVVVRGATVARQLFPIRGRRGRVIAVLVMDSYWFAHERHRRRARVFQDALREFTHTALRGGLQGVGEVVPFGEHDGIMFVGADRRIRYLSGVASGLFRRLGYRDNLVGHRVSDLETVDPLLVSQVLADQARGVMRCAQREDVQFGQTWIRQALPVCGARDGSAVGRVLGDLVWRWGSGRRGSSRLAADGHSRYARGVLILIHDATGALETRRELESKLSLIREVHHRVKNNLQVIASLMRMQARRALSAEARTALEESVNRILSVAVVHEFLSRDTGGSNDGQVRISLLEVARRIVGQVQQSLVDPGKSVTLGVQGPDVWLPAERATQCALVINELVQNAIEHGLGEREQGTVRVDLEDHGEQVCIVVSDDGRGLPQDFDLSTGAHLGLTIVRSMVERDLRGQFELTGSQAGTRARLCFGKSSMGGN